MPDKPSAFDLASRASFPVFPLLEYRKSLVEDVRRRLDESSEAHNQTTDICDMHFQILRATDGQYFWIRSPVTCLASCPIDEQPSLLLMARIYGGSVLALQTIEGKETEEEEEMTARRPPHPSIVKPQLFPFHPAIEWPLIVGWDENQNRN